MNLYRDDDSVDTLLIRLLQHAGHDVQIPADVGMSGEDDSVHLAHAIRGDRALLSHNHRDFRNLHNLIMQARVTMRESSLCAGTTIQRATSNRQPSYAPFAIWNRQRSRSGMNTTS